ncbi:tumor necrosis factor receptor superfamily member 14-like [Brachyhypopomus gauderio]|uniref:tumor necrosis factor receptor superfamily member 14-like n=1 Tax=Brachyhypopomus gauderio TaxID=698409 RepID=UPI0040415E8C
MHGTQVNRNSRKPKPHDFQIYTGTASEIVRLLHVIGVYAVLAHGHKCGESEYVSASGECCHMCNIGSMVLKDCKGDSDTTCIPCSPATYMNKANSLQKCLPCKICDHGQGLSVSKVCSTIQNTVCGVLNGFYCRDYTVDECTFALKHKKCQPGQEVKVQGTTISDTVCEVCPHGFYSTLGVNCTKWTDCSSRNEDVSEEGSSVQDVKCKPIRYRHGLTAFCVVAAFLLCFVVFQKAKYQLHKEKWTEAKLLWKKPILQLMPQRKTRRGSEHQTHKEGKTPAFTNNKNRVVRQFDCEGP